MKKALSILLVLVLCLSLCACGGSNDAPKATEAPVEATESTELKIGDAFGTDTVECVIEEITWFTTEEFTSNSDNNNQFVVIDGKSAIIQGDHWTLDTEKLFPGYHAWGISGMMKDKVSEYAFLCVKHTLQNIGKEKVDVGMESLGVMGMISVPYGTMEVIYDDGYTFNFGNDDIGKNIGFITPLAVLGDPVNEVMIINLPTQVLENADKPLKLKVMLPSSNGEVEEFIVSIR